MKPQQTSPEGSVMTEEWRLDGPIGLMSTRVWKGSTFLNCLSLSAISWEFEGYLEEHPIL